MAKSPLPYHGTQSLCPGYIATDVRENRKETKDVKDIVHQIDKRTARLEYQTITMDGKVTMREAFRLFEALKKTDGR